MVCYDASMIRTRRRSAAPFVALSVALAALVACAPAVHDADLPEPLRVSAAASLREVAEEIAAAFSMRRAIPPIELNIAGSNTLARQIEAAPVADVFLSADAAWIDFLAERGHVVEGSARPLFSNRLVVVARRDAPVDDLDQLADLASVDFRHLALADPEAVPAGRYARAALSRVPGGPGEAGLWDAVRERIVPTLDVRAALGLVRSDPAILGVVYRTDTRSQDDVRIVLELEPDPAVAIAYHGALVATDADDRSLARAFLAFFDDAEAREILDRHGFVTALPAKGSPS